jgi:hypothetical protein
MGVAKFGDLLITDHQAASHFKCIQFMGALNRNQKRSIVEMTPVLDADSSDSKFYVELRLGKPEIELYKHDLEWWMNYFRLQPVQQLLDTFKRPQPEFDVDEPKTLDLISPTVYLHLELNGFQCVLRLRDGPVIVVGVETAGLKCDHRLQSVEFEVESLWCHRASADFEGGLLSQLTFDQHIWGTTVAIGAGCAQLIRPKNNRIQIYVQIDDCQFEWEEAVMSHIIEYVRLFQKPSIVSKQKSGQDLISTPVQTPSSSIEVQVLLSAKKLSLIFTAKNAAFVVLSMETFRLDLQHRNDGTRAHITLESVRVGMGELDHRYPLPSMWWNRQVCFF